jgi:hypothetical protein
MEGRSNPLSPISNPQIDKEEGSRVKLFMFIHMYMAHQFPVSRFPIPTDIDMGSGKKHLWVWEYDGGILLDSSQKLGCTFSIGNLIWMTFVLSPAPLLSADIFASHFPIIYRNITVSIKNLNSEFCFHRKTVMPCQLSEEINSYVNDDVFSYMCNLAMEKCSRKTEKKKASCGGAAMRKRLCVP